MAFVGTTSRPTIGATLSSEMSVDNQTWRPLPAGVKVTGSKWVLVLSELSLCDDSIDLGAYRVAIGPSLGKSATDYLRGQSDKACVERLARPGPPGVRQVSCAAD